MSSHESDDLQTGIRGETSDQSATSRDKRSGYLAFAAHEVRNPLSTALWSAELLARIPEAERGGARGEKLAAMCLRALTRLRLLVEDHFLIERLDAGGLPLRTEPLDLGEVLAAVISRRLASSNPCEAEEFSDLVSADRGLLEHSLEALLGTAGRDGTPVRVSRRYGNGRISLVFQGAPPPESGLEDPDRGSPAEGKGYSLSLPMVCRAARALGGELQIEGGAFVLSLPLRAASEAPLSEE